MVDHRVIDQLVDAYRRLRQVAHRLSLEEQPPVVPAAPFADQRQAVTRIWQDVMLAGREPSPL